MPTTFSLKPSPTLVIERLLRLLAERARRARAARQRRRQAHAAFTALDQLDARLLRDIGLDRSELSSVAAELSGTTEPQRTVVMTRAHAIR